jgi:hypothetical protein
LAALCGAEFNLQIFPEDIPMNIIRRIAKKISTILGQPAVTPPNPVVVAQAAVRRLGEDQLRIAEAEALLLQLLAERAEAARLNAIALEEAINATNSMLGAAQTALQEEIARQNSLRDQEIARLQQAIAAVRAASARKKNQLSADHADFRLSKEGEIEEAASVLAVMQHVSLSDPTAW